LPSRLRVRLGFLSGALVLALAHPTSRTVGVGLLLAVPGEALRLWASGHIEKTRILATGGPYAYTRNPLYLGSLLLMLGVAVASGSPWASGILLLYAFACYPSVVSEEAAFLRRTFPEYETWSQAVPLFFPRLSPGGPRASRFSWERVGRNREWRAALALPGMVALLYLRQLLP
jgi:protein-S-isoprenylcysteine O-methyltransferase Ste14